MAGTVAVTGATGFVGSHVVPALAGAGWRVRVLIRRFPLPMLGGDNVIEAIIGSVEDEDGLRRLVRGCDAVVHLAGVVKARTASEFFRVNADGVSRLARLAATQSPPPRLLLVSSIAAREPSLSAYAASKRAGEAALESAGPEVPWTILRPPAIYGPGDRETLSFFRWIARGVAPRVGGRECRLSLLHVRDFATAVVAALTTGRDVLGATYELDDGRPGGYSWSNMAEAAGQVLRTRLRPLQVPAAMLCTAAAANVVVGAILRRTPMLTPGKAREILHPDWVCHDRAFERQTGWQAAIRLPEGFAETVIWYRAHGWL